jgi:hypothetical protein
MKSIGNTLIREITYFAKRNRPKKVLFDHFPKCAGTSVSDYLKSQHLPRKTYTTSGSDPLESVSQFKALPEKIRFSYDLIYGHCAHELLDFTHPDKITLTILRDPVERIISHYFYVKRTRYHYLHEPVLQSSISLEEYATSGLSIELRNFYVSHYLETSYQEAERCPEKSIARACRIVEEKYDIIGFTDNLNTAMESLRRKALYRQPFQERKLNISTCYQDRKEIDKSVLDTIRQVNFMDVEFYKRLKQKSYAFSAGTLRQ